jgi:protein-S-isoprenylcysteine O-methyltransferase Ste14
MKAVSALCLLLMVAGLAGLFYIHALFSTSPVVIGLQAAAAALMLWARLTFGRRSFHATAAPTEGGLVTSGPYRFLRHPIYSAVFLFSLAGVCAHLSLEAGGLLLAVFLGAFGRMFAEEKLLRARYPEYAAYAQRTSRVLPYVF